MAEEKMRIQVLKEAFSVCQMRSGARWDLEMPFVFFAKTDEEESLVCPMAYVPDGVMRQEDGWRAFRIEGVLDFSLVGILAEISGMLAKEGISIFAISTYRTDYVLVRQERLREAMRVLAQNGYEAETEII